MIISLLNLPVQEDSFLFLVTDGMLYVQYGVVLHVTRKTA
jgi:hypothetical protein